MFFSPNKLQKRYILMLVATLFSAASTAQAAELLTLKQSIQQTLEKNRQLLAAGQHVEQMQEKVNVEQGKRMPRVDLSTGWNYSNSPLQVFGSKLQQQSVTAADFIPNTLNHPNYRQNYQTRLGLSLPLFAGGALQATEDEASAQSDAASMRFEFQKQQQMYQTIVAFIQARQYWEQLEISKKAVSAAEKRWQDAGALQNRGMALTSDVMNAHVHLLRSQVAVDEASSLYQNSLDTLQLIMGTLANTNDLQLSPAHLTPPSASLETLLTRADNKRLDLRAMQQQSQAIEAQRKQSHASDLPHVHLVAAQEWNSATPALQHGNSMIGVTIQMNLFAGGRDHAQQRIIESSYDAWQWKVMDQRQAIGNEIRQAWRTLQVAQKKLQREEEAFQQTQEALRIQSLRYQQGLEKTSDLLDAQVQLDHSQVNRIRAQSDIMISTAALLLAAGELNEGVIQ